jgi:hypothetical protein
MARVSVNALVPAADRTRTPSASPAGTQTAAGRSSDAGLTEHPQGRTVASHAIQELVDQLELTVSAVKDTGAVAMSDLIVSAQAHASAFRSVGHS